MEVSNLTTITKNKKMKKVKTFILGALSLVSLSTFALGEAELDGYCPVCYISSGKAVQGLKEFKSEYKGDTYYFVHAKAKSVFDRTPEKFIPQFDGLCAYGISLGKTFESDPTQFAVVDGKLYLNSSAETQKLFEAKPAETIKAANGKWGMVSKEIMAKEMKEKEMMEKEKMSK